MFLLFCITKSCICTAKINLLLIMYDLRGIKVYLDKMTMEETLLFHISSCQNCSSLYMSVYIRVSFPTKIVRVGNYFLHGLGNTLNKTEVL